MHPTSATNTLHSYILRTTLMALSAVALLLASAGTAVACGPNGEPHAAVLSPPRMFSAVPGQPAEDNSQRGIVGLWHVYYTDSTGNPFYEAYDMWHADGNEWETSFGDPRQGNYCLGVWKKVGPRTVQLSHFGWLYNSDGTPAGYFTLAETDTVSRKGDSYTGTFDFKQYDANGNFLVEVTGTPTATRFHL